jgi:hypothetical protein
MTTVGIPQPVIEPKRIDPRKMTMHQKACLGSQCYYRLTALSLHNTAAVIPRWKTLSRSQRREWVALALMN